MEDRVPFALLGRWGRGGRQIPSVSGTGLQLANDRAMISLTEILLRKERSLFKTELCKLRITDKHMERSQSSRKCKLKLQ